MTRGVGPFSAFPALVTVLLLLVPLTRQKGPYDLCHAGNFPTTTGVTPRLPMAVISCGNASAPRLQEAPHKRKSGENRRGFVPRGPLRRSTAPCAASAALGDATVPVDAAGGALVDVRHPGRHHTPDLGAQGRNERAHHGDKQREVIVEVEVANECEDDDEDDDLQQPPTKDHREGRRGRRVCGEQHRQRRDEHEAAAERRADEHAPHARQPLGAAPHQQRQDGDRRQRPRAIFHRALEGAARVVEVGDVVDPGVSHSVQAYLRRDPIPAPRSSDEAYAQSCPGAAE